MDAEHDEFGVDERREFFHRIDRLNSELENARRLEKVSWEKSKKLSSQLSTMIQRAMGLEKAMAQLPQCDELLQEFVVPLRKDIAVLARQTSWKSSSSTEFESKRSPTSSSTSQPKASSPSRTDPQSWFVSQDSKSVFTEEKSKEKSEEVESPKLDIARVDAFYIGDSHGASKPLALSSMRTSDPGAPDVWTGLNAAAWTNRDCCDICQRSFRPLRQWHHCRKCARCVCSKCSPFRVALKSTNVPTGVVVHPPVGELMPNGSPRAHRICWLCA